MLNILYIITMQLDRLRLLKFLKHILLRNGRPR